MVRRPGRKRRVREVYKRPESEHIEIKGASPSIVSSELFERAQARLDDPERHAQHNPSRTYPLRGRLRCHCGAAMTGHAVNRGRYSYYRCNRLYLSAEDERCASRMVRTEVLESAVRQTLSELLAEPAMVLEMAEALRFDPGNGARLGELERDLGKLRESQGRLVDLYTDGQIEKALLDEKVAALVTRKAALEREQARLLAEAEPGCDPEVLRERMPEALAFISEWVRRADGDELVLLAQALEARIEVSPEGAEIRVEVPRIEPGKGGNFATIEQTSAPLFRSDKIERVPVVMSAPLLRLKRRRRATAPTSHGASRRSSPSLIPTQPAGRVAVFLTGHRRNGTDSIGLKPDIPVSPWPGEYGPIPWRRFYGRPDGRTLRQLRKGRRSPGRTRGHTSLAMLGSLAPSHEHRPHCS